MDIVYEDSDVIVINKPNDMIVHPTLSIVSNTLVNAILYHCPDLSGINGVNRPGIVHRIDKETSGLLMVAKNDLAHRSLSQQLKDHTVTRSYVALVHGEFPHNHGRIDAPIGRDPKDRQKMTVKAEIPKTPSRISRYWKISGLFPGGVPPGNWPDPSDPGPYGLHRSSGTRRSKIWVSQG